MEPQENINGSLPSDSDKQTVTLMHILNIFIGIISPLIFWFIKKDESKFIDEAGRNSMNFNISMIIYSFVSSLLITIFIGLITTAAIAIFHIVILIIAAVKANRGEVYKFPLTISFIN